MNRVARIQQLAVDRDLDAVLVTPGADLRYLTGYAAKPLERLTCLVVRRTGDPVLVAPELEVAAARAAGTDLEIAAWSETDDPFALVASLLPGARAIALDDQMWASRVLGLRDAMPEARQTLAGPLIGELRMRKDAAEIAALREAGEAIDRVHLRVSEWLRPGRSEREVGRDIAAAIVEEGHAQVDFVIVGSGPNGASPHHEVSDRVIRTGDPVVVDIGGTTAAGYCSDCTRNYVVGDEPPAAYLEAYAVLEAAQAAQRSAAGPGMPAEEVDRIGRAVITEAGYGDLFIHRTGHGIGTETHEEPYIVTGNTRLLEPGMAFSIEPGIYHEGQFGARIEDIVVCTDDGIEVLNTTDRGLVRLPA
ncbi:Creatinase [Aeromicrobium marinum DSM 15272]|uniref:Creatinase n=1 Tax=Aeromicrobium marinum DSM 15272 TaxID=585531 RepID=E2S9U8_9ACTN|nr:M24 family metallopeptidase [Aeromicrobium marinum]EFQ84022.1 Creatinase [Aeromicrobium marinum DSM 15272]